MEYRCEGGMWPDDPDATCTGNVFHAGAYLHYCGGAETCGPLFFQSPGQDGMPWMPGQLDASQFEIADCWLSALRDQSPGPLVFRSIWGSPFGSTITLRPTGDGRVLVHEQSYAAPDRRSTAAKVGKLLAAERLEACLATTDPAAKLSCLFEQMDAPCDTQPLTCTAEYCHEPRCGRPTEEIRTGEFELAKVAAHGDLVHVGINCFDAPDCPFESSGVFTYSGAALGELNLESSVESSNNVHHIARTEDLLLVQGQPADLMIYDIRDPRNPRAIGEGDRVRSIVASETRLYATRTTGFHHVFDLEVDPGLPFPWTELAYVEEYGYPLFAAGPWTVTFHTGPDDFEIWHVDERGRLETQGVIGDQFIERPLVLVGDTLWARGPEEHLLAEYVLEYGAEPRLVELHALRDRVAVLSTDGQRSLAVYTVTDRELPRVETVELWGLDERGGSPVRKGYLDCQAHSELSGQECGGLSLREIEGAQLWTGSRDWKGLRRIDIRDCGF